MTLFARSYFHPLALRQKGRFLRSVPFAVLLSCLQIGPSPNADGGGIDAAAAEAQVEAGATNGSGCGVEPVSGVTLCATIDLCPGVLVDREIYPDCGFRVPSSTIELACVCGEFLCPIGTALGCTQAQRLLATQSGAAACLQASEGRCAPLHPSTPGGGASCDQTCLAGCVGDPTCVTLCGC